MNDGITLRMYSPHDAAVHLSERTIASLETLRKSVRKLERVGPYCPVIVVQDTCVWYEASSEELRNSGVVRGDAGRGAATMMFVTLRVAREGFTVWWLSGNDRGIEQWAYSHTVFWDDFDRLRQSNTSPAHP